MYSVTYVSHLETIYFETKLFKSEQAAFEQVAEYVKDICETEGWDYEDCGFEVGQQLFSQSCFNGHYYEVRMTYHEDSKII